MSAQMMPKIQLLTLITGLFVLPTWSAHISFSGFNCIVVDPTFVAFDHCIMKPVSRGVKEISSTVRLLQVPVTNVSVRLELTRRGNNKNLLYTFEIDGCRFWLAKRRNPVASAVYKFLRLESVSNINHSCPYDHDIIVDRFRVDDTLELYLPISLGEYVIKTYWMAYNVLRAIVTANMKME